MDCSRTHWLSVWAKGGKPEETSKKAVSISFIVHEPSLELKRYGQNRGSIRCRRSRWRPAHGAGDPVNFFPFAFLIESDGAENGSQDHAWAVNPGKSLVHADLSVRFGSRNFGRADGIVRANKIQISGHRAKSKMGPAVACAGALAAGTDSQDDRGDQWSGIDQTDALMNLKHVRPLVESRLILRVSLGLSRREAEIPERERATQRQIHGLLGSCGNRHFGDIRC